MSNEHWEEISDWEIEEDIDIDLAQRITVHAVHSVDDEEEFQLIQAHKNPTYAAAAKWGDRKSSSKNEGTSKANKKISEESEKKSSSASPKNSKNNDKSENDILKGDHDVDYENSAPQVSSKNWKETRRSNTKLHKIHSIKLMSSLVSNAELESNQDLVKGDTNRDPEFKKYKLLKKSMASNKKYEKSRNDRKNIERFEVW